VALLLSGGLALVTLAQTQDSRPQRPWLINSTYTVTLGDKRTATVHPHEENGQLTIDEKETNFPASSCSVKYDEVNFVEVLEFGGYGDLSGKKRTVGIGTSRARTSYGALGEVIVLPSENSGKGYSAINLLPPTVEVILPTAEDADAVAEYVARKARVHLELIAGAWRVRKPFECPEAGQPGCKDFKELLDRNDPEIAYFFYSEYGNVYACFDNEESHFLLVRYGSDVRPGNFFLESFTQGQAGWPQDLGEIKWSPFGFGEIIQHGFQTHGKKPQMGNPITSPRFEIVPPAKSLGSIDSSSLSYHSEFTNKMDTTTQYELTIRWSTGRYTESWSGKDDKGKPFSENSNGIASS